MKKGIMQVKLVFATDYDDNFGNLDGSLPWEKNADDLANFRAHTVGHPVIMGRKTFESLPCRLKYRQNIVMSNTHKLPVAKNGDKPHERIKGATLEDLLLDLEASGVESVAIIGGAELLKEAYQYATTIYHTEHKDFLDADIKLSTEEIYHKDSPFEVVKFTDYVKLGFTTTELVRIVTTEKE
jgi:dihydrofolate reductase